MSSCLRNTYRFVAVLPLVFIILLVGWSYYAYVVALCIYSVPSANIAEKVCFIFFYHIFFGLFVWSYLQTIIAKPIQPPDDFRLTISEWTELHDANLEPSIRRDRILSIISERHLPVYTRGPDNSVRLCSICHLIKPDRAHHCATCGVCMLKMDHHCPWVNNCVGLHNYKYFVLFLLYGSLYCFYIGCSSAKYFVSFWTEGVSDVQSSRFHVLFLFFAAWMFSISLLALGGYHVHLTMRNLTTLEGFRAPVLSGTAGPDKRAYNVGFGRNFCQVFGDKCYMWLLPLRTWNIDGIHWQHKASYSPGQRSYSAMESGAGSPSRVVERQQLVTSQTTGETDKIWAESDARD